MRIEVGYGLEGTLTDALSNVIITNQIVPRFKAGDFAGGIERGVDGIIAALTTDTERLAEEAASPQPTIRTRPSPACCRSCIVGLFIFVFWMMQRHAARTRRLGWRRPDLYPDGIGLGRRLVLGWRLVLGRRRRLRRLLRRRRLVGRRRRLGKLVMAITADDQPASPRRSAPPSRGTSGEIVCVLARSSSEYNAAPVLVGALLALIMPWVLVFLTQWSIERILLAQFCVFVLVTAIVALTPSAWRLVPRRIKRVRAHRAAMEQFHSRGLGRLDSRAGILIYVSLAERYARIIVDDHLAATIPAGEWRAQIDALTAHMKDGRIADGFVAAIESCGAILEGARTGRAKRQIAGPDLPRLIRLSASRKDRRPARARKYSRGCVLQQRRRACLCAVEFPNLVYEIRLVARPDRPRAAQPEWAGVSPLLCTLINRPARELAWRQSRRGGSFGLTSSSFLRDP